MVDKHEINNKFKKGQGGRPKGAKNKFSADFREKLLIAAGEVAEETLLENGEDCEEGKDYVIEYLKMLAANEPRSYASMLSKLIPSQVTGDDFGPVETKGNLTVEEAVALVERMEKAKNNG